MRFGLLWLFWAALVRLSQGGLPANESHCLENMKLRWQSTVDNLEDNNEWSMASSVSVSPFPQGKGTLLVAGEYLTDKYVLSEGKSFLRGSILPNSYGGNESPKATYTKTWDWDSKSDPIDATTFRSITRVLAHPNKDVAFVTGSRRIAAFTATTGSQLWVKSGDDVPRCDEENEDDKVLYDGLLVLPNDDKHLLVSGTCNNSHSVVLDVYSVSGGQLLRRNKYSIWKFLPAFAKMADFSILPPSETSMSAPVTDDVYTEVGNTFFYLGVSHILFVGTARVTFDMKTYEATPDTSGLGSTFINPTVYMHRSVVSDNSTGVISLLDPIMFDVLTAGGKHLIRYDLKERFGSWKESQTYATYVWYGGHWYLNFKWDWTLASHGYSTDNKHVYVLSTPIPTDFEELKDPFQKSFISQQNIHNGEQVGGGRVDYTVTDGVLSPDGKTMFVVGFQLEWTKDSMKKKFKRLHVFNRFATVSAFKTETEESECVGCETMYYGDECAMQCDCHSGYCDDDLEGTGQCLCYLDTYGEYCDPCKCAATKGICHSGPKGTGMCLFCFDLDIFNLKIGWPKTWGEYCNRTTHCDPDFGLSNPLGESGKNGCFYCFNETQYGEYCNITCHCDEGQECDHGVHGEGCVKKEHHKNYDYGGLTFKNQFWVYGLVGAIFFLVFFFLTWIQAIEAPEDVKRLPIMPIPKSQRVAHTGGINDPVYAEFTDDGEI